MYSWALSLAENQIIPSKLEEYELFHCLFSEIPALASPVSLGQNREHCKSLGTAVERKKNSFCSQVTFRQEILMEELGCEFST